MHDHELDLQVDRALRNYALPSEGLEGRVLTALAAERANAAPRRWFARPRIWIASGALAACALLAFLIAIRPVHKTPQQIAGTASPAPITQAVPEAPAARNAAPQPLAAATVHKPLVRQHRPAPLPKQQLFPSPQPLSPQIQALMQFAAHAPLKERQALVQAQAHFNAPIAIAPLRIAPLNITSSQVFSPQEDR